MTQSNVAFMGIGYPPLDSGKLQNFRRGTPEGARRVRTVGGAVLT